MKNTLETRLGIFVALNMIVAFLILEMLGGLEHFKRGIRLHALFNTVQELKEGDPVKLAGVQVGRVEKAAGADARTVAELWAQKGTLEGKPVTVRGRGEGQQRRHGQELDPPAGRQR